VYSALTGQRIQRITPNDAQASDFFGVSVGLDLNINTDGLLAIGASLDDDMGDGAGAMYIFNPMTGVQVDKIYADDAAAGDAFGNVLAVDDGLIAIGSPLDDDLGTSSGSAYIFDLATGNQLFKLLADDGLAGDGFGSVISISGGIVAVGAWQRDDLGGSSGAVYLFDASTGLQTHKLLPDDGAADDRFGFSVSISNGKVLVGAFRDDIFGTWSGSAYIFDALTGVQLEKLAPAAGDPQELFGRSVSIHNTNIGVSAIGNGDAGFKSGSAYVFTLPVNECLADLTGDGILNFFDVSAFLSAFTSGDPLADFTGDGMYNFFDVSAFLQAFAAGCP
jgi:WD40 repeat protein